MKWPLLAIVRRHTEWGPDAAGATSVNLLPRRPRRGQAAAPLALSGAGRKLRFRPVLGTALRAERMRAEPACSFGAERVVLAVGGPVPSASARRLGRLRLRRLRLS